MRFGQIQDARSESRLSQEGREVTSAHGRLIAGGLSVNRVRERARTGR